MTLVVASVRGEVASYVDKLILVYTTCIIAWIVAQLVFSFGARVPWSRPLNALLDFLRDVSEPYLRLFRPLPLRLGPLDLTPLVAILVLQLGGAVVVGLIQE